MALAELAGIQPEQLYQVRASSGCQQCKQALALSTISGVSLLAASVCWRPSPGCRLLVPGSNMTALRAASVA
jgi:hypothetical protein